MSKVKENDLTMGLSGKFGRQFIFRNVKGQTIAARQSAKSRKRSKQTQAQKDHINRFRAAVVYAKAALADEARRLAYAEKAANMTYAVSAYNIAVADYLHAPEINEINVSEYTGQAGEEIIVSAIDNFKVTEVKVEIRQGDDTLVEKGVAVVAPTGLEWVYTTQSVNASPAGCRIIVRVMDTPGNATVKEMVI